MTRLNKYYKHIDDDEELYLHHYEPAVLELNFDRRVPVS